MIWIPGNVMSSHDGDNHQEYGCGSHSLPVPAHDAISRGCRPERRSDALERLQEVARFDAKSPSLPFERHAAPAPGKRPVTEMAARFADAEYERLEAVRRPQSA